MTSLKLFRKPYADSFDFLVNDLFADMPTLFKNVNNYETKGLVPVNVKETDKSYQLEVIAPGFEKTDFKVDIDHDLLTIEAERKKEEKEETEKQIRTEYSYRSFKRSFTMDEKIDATNIEASYINGVLTLNLPKKVDVKTPATKIEIK
ncbi:MAG: Hsp20/alpha crystallin family protein [Sphingobacteriales bacterium]|nr:Hsp20/alpha crystallin family protein [Sphingobacteriales bacterium]